MTQFTRDQTFSSYSIDLSELGLESAPYPIQYRFFFARALSNCWIGSLALWRTLLLVCRLAFFALEKRWTAEQFCILWRFLLVQLTGPFILFSVLFFTPPLLRAIFQPSPVALWSICDLCRSDLVVWLWFKCDNAQLFPWQWHVDNRRWGTKR
jgi:hypothetical protein